MNFNKGNYEPKVVKDTIVGKSVKCSICGLDSDSICLTVGQDFVFKIITASYDIDPEGYFWELTVVNVRPETEILDMTAMKETIITDLDVIDNFYEQLV